MMQKQPYPRRNQNAADHGQHKLKHVYAHTHICAHINVHVRACVYIYECVDMYMCVDIMYQCKRCIYSFHAAECVTLQFINT